MPSPSALQQFILLPPRGLVAGEVGMITPSAASLFRAMETARVRAFSAPPRALATPKLPAKMRVLDSIRENGAKLVEMTPQAASDLRAEQPGLRVVPVVYFRPAWASWHKASTAPPKVASAASTVIGVKVVSSVGQRPVEGVNVQAFTDFAGRIGAGGTTNKQGQVSLALGAGSRQIERLYLYCESRYWNGLRRGLTLRDGDTVEVDPIDLRYKDALRHFYGAAPDDAGAGVKVGVIDTGVAAHPDLVIDGGLNTVGGEDPNDFGDNGEGHGTHVAGIIAARGRLPGGFRGLAPGVTLRVYRVFPKKTGEKGTRAPNFAILKAIDQAVSDGCDLINMSLGGVEPDEATHSAIAHARANGTLALVAAGNDQRGAVGFPASDSLALAISAMGRKGTFPADSIHADEVAAPYGKDKANFIAAFSNVGPETDLTAPGVGIISTWPGDAYAAINGTSMACPAAVGAAARLLAKKPAVLAMARDQARSDAMARLVLKAARALGFGATFEGQGML